MAIVFGLLSNFLEGIWPYYVPSALIGLSLWLKAIQPTWVNDVDSLRMPVSKMDPSAAAGYVSIISGIYGIVSVFLGYWIPLFLCVGVFVLSLTMKFRHPY
jgi:hypothetical protein